MTDGTKSNVLRPVLMLGGVVIVVVGALLFWLQGGRVVSVDDAMIGAAKLPVSTDISGIVAAVAVHEGQVVHQGDLLFSLDDKPFRIARDAAQADLAQTVLDVSAMKQDYQRLLHAAGAAEAKVQADQASFNRYANLVRGGSVTQSDYDDARFRLAADEQDLARMRSDAQAQLARLGGSADIDPAETPIYQRARARLDEAERQLAHTKLDAPFDGVVTQVEAVQPGMYLAASTPAFALVATGNVWVDGNPKETELTHIRQGQSVSITVDAYPGEVWQGEVESIAPAAGGQFSVLPAQNTSGNWVKVVQRVPLRVRITPRQDAPQLRAGMSVVADINTGHVRHLRDLF